MVPDESQVPPAARVDDHGLPRQSVMVAAEPRWRGRWFLLLVTGVLVLGAVAVRMAAWTYTSPDFTFYLAKWYATLQHDGFSAFARPFSEYNPPYLYLLWVASAVGLPALVGVKVVSALGDLGLALSVFALLRSVHRPMLVSVSGALAVLYIPTVLLNSAFWGQSDAFYTAFLIWSVALAVRDRHVAAWLVFGVALAFKLQAVFLLPMLVAVWLIRPRERWWTPVVAVAPVLGGLVPAWLAGRSTGSLLHIYVSQTDNYRLLSYAPNIWAWVPRGNDALISKVALGVTFAACVAILGLAVVHRSRLLDPRGLVGLAALVLLLVPFLLPHMRERYFYPGEIVILAFAFTMPRAAWAATAVLVVSFMANLENLMHLQMPWSYAQLSLVILVAMGYLMVLLFRMSEPGVGPVVAHHPARPHTATQEGEAGSSGPP